MIVKKESQNLQNIQQKAEQELQQKASVRTQYITNVQTILQNKLKEKDLRPVLLIDCELLEDKISEDLIKDIWKLKPFVE